MDIDGAYQNLSQILLFGRIVTPMGALTGQEHSELQGNLHLLYNQAKENQETKIAAKKPEENNG